MSAYRKKPVVIEARKFDPSASLQDAADIAKWCGGRITGRGLVIPTLEGEMLASPGDFVIQIQGVYGEFYPCRSDIFAETYEAAE
jgi:hypothetical protein